MNFNRVKRLLNPSWAERRFARVMGLWYYLFMFRREYKIGRLWVDFATTFLGKRVVVEVDGKSWHKDVIRDWERDQVLEKLGWSVIRVEASALNDPRRVRREVVRFVLHTAPRLRKPKAKRVNKKP